MKIAAATILVALSCSTHTGPQRAEFGWVRPVNSPESQFHAARVLAEQIVRLPTCHEALSGLPDWPPGPVLTEFVTAWPPGNATTLARTLWRDASAEHSALPARIEIHSSVLQSRGIEILALVLIHELAHASSLSDFAGLEAGEAYARAMESNEQQARKITGICSRAAGIVA